MGLSLTPVACIWLLSPLGQPLRSSFAPTLLSAGDPPSYRRWAIQLAEWVGCVVAARALCGTLVVLLGSLLAHVAQVRWAGRCWWESFICHPHLPVPRLLHICLLWLQGMQGGGWKADWPLAVPLLPVCRAWTACLWGIPRCYSTL